MKELYKALAAFTQEVPVIHKGTAGYNYSYADLPAIFEVINPLLKKHGLGFYQAVDTFIEILPAGDKKAIPVINTTVFHIESGESIDSTTPMPTDVDLGKMNTFQVMGSGITYIRRYALSSLLGLVTDKDTDAATLKTNTSSSELDF